MRYQSVAKKEIPDLFALADGVMIKSNEVWSTPNRRGFLPDRKSTYMRKVRDGRLPPPDIDQGPGSRYYIAKTLKSALLPALRSLIKDEKAT